ncbi:hypothetical protein ACHAQJ_009894 [Trichoderma viride]
MSVITDTSILIIKSATEMTRREHLLEALLLVIVLILAQVQWIRQATSYLFRRIQGLLYLVWGPELIDRAYDKAQGKAFKVFTPSNDHLLVTSIDLIRELIDAPLQQLSLHAVAKEILQPKYTMHGFEWQDQRGVEGTGFVRALRSLLTSHLPRFQPDLERLVKDTLEIELKGVQLDAQNTEFTAAALEFPQAVIFAAEFLRITPRFVRPLVASMATNRHRAAKTLYRYLVPIVEQRLVARDLQPNKTSPMDCMQWLIDTSPRKNPWTPGRIVVTCRRKALVSYTFQDGSFINKGDWACVPQRAMMQDSTRYKDPQTFDGFRFARPNAKLRQRKHFSEVPDRESNMTEISPDWLIWGFGNTACPGRFYASLVTKLILIRILDEWECKMPYPEAPRATTWRSSMVPRSNTIVMFRKKQL